VREEAPAYPAGVVAPAIVIARHAPHRGERAAAAYSRFKQTLAAAVDDIDVYTDVKDPVVDLVVVGAEHWADTTGWTLGTA
jgi:hypothetical protein